MANNPITFIDPDGEQITGYEGYLDRQFATEEGARRTIEAHSQMREAIWPVAKGVARAGVDFAVGTLKLVTGLLGASWGEETIVETVEGVKNLPQTVKETVRDWDELPAEEKAYRITTGVLIVRGAYKLSKTGVDALAKPGKAPAVPETVEGVAAKPLQPKLPAAKALPPEPPAPKSLPPGPPGPEALPTVLSTGGKTVGLGGRILTAVQQFAFDAFAVRAQALGWIQNPFRTGSWGKTVSGKFQELGRIDVAEPGKPGWRGKTHIHVTGREGHLDPKTKLPGE